MATLRTVLAISAGLLSGCSGAGAGQSGTPPPRAGRAPSPVATSASEPASFATEEVALVPAGTFGPYVGSRPEATIVAWAPEEGGKRTWMTAALGPSGARVQGPTRLGDAAAEIDLVAVRPLAPSAAFLLVTSSRAFSGARIDALMLGLRGELVGAPIAVAESLTEVTWLDVVPTPEGALAMWAVRRGDRADLFAAAIGPKGEVKPQPAPVLSDVSAWQVATLPSGAAVSGVGAGKERGDPGPVRLVVTDASGKVTQRVTVSESATAEPDLDMSRIGDRLVLAWSDGRTLDSSLFSAVLDLTGKIVKPAAPLGRPFGPQALLRLVSPAAEGSVTFAAWENLIERSSVGRVIRLATLSGEGALGAKSALLDLAATDGTVPEFAATARGVAAITVSPPCRRQGPCTAQSAVPTFVELDAALDVKASEPMRLTALGGDVADLVWGLTCRSSDCLAFASAPVSPAPVYAVPLRALSNEWQPAARSADEGPPPRVVEVEALARTDPVSDLSAARLGQVALVGWVTSFDPATPFTRQKTAAPDGKYEPIRAVLRMSAVPERGAAPEPSVLSYRAQSLGGVAISPGDPAKNEALVAWVGIDAQKPQVFVTLVGADGKKIAQKMLTKTKGGAADVALAFVGDGWVVGWIDERDGAAQAYVAKVDRTLKSVVPERRVNGSQSVQTGLQLLARGEHVFAVWSDARGSTSGAADVFAARLSVKDLSPVGPEHSLAATPAHSRSPSVAALGEGAVAAWVEDPAPGVEGAISSVMLQRIDSGAEPGGGAARAVALSASARSVHIACSASACRVAATVAGEGTGGVDAFEWRPGAPLVPARLVRLGSPPRDAAPPAVVENDVFYADDARGSGRVRRLGVAWQ